MADKYILLVEDNPDDIALTRMALARGKIASKLAVVQDGQEAIDFLLSRGKYMGRDAADKPAVILLDLKLPKVSGLEVLEKVRAGNGIAHIPVIVLTSSTEKQDQSDSFRLGADEYISKPTSLTELVRIVCRISKDWLE